MVGRVSVVLLKKIGGRLGVSGSEAELLKSDKHETCCDSVSLDGRCRLVVAAAGGQWFGR